jgi:hypothetical protein
LEVALARIAELEARLARLEKPPKTPDNSSLPPSNGQKPNDPPAGVSGGENPRIDGVDPFRTGIWLRGRRGLRR